MLKQLTRKLFKANTPPSKPISKRSPRAFPRDFDQAAIDTIRFVKPYTMTSFERLFGLIRAVEYITEARIPGHIVECGVWKGGSMMAVAHTLKRLGSIDRDLFLFDTYQGMTKPTEDDVSHAGHPAIVKFEQTQMSENTSDWCYAPLEEVQSNIARTAYPADKLHFIKGDVTATIPDSAPAQIALLRLDTDWYESTHHELVHLYPRLSAGAVLIIDDYGCWQGSRKATDEYLAKHNIHLLLNRLDYTGRIAIKR